MRDALQDKALAKDIRDLGSTLERRTRPGRGVTLKELPPQEIGTVIRQMAMPRDFPCCGAKKRAGRTMTAGAPHLDKHQDTLLQAPQDGTHSRDQSYKAAPPLSISDYFRIAAAQS